MLSASTDKLLLFASWLLLFGPALRWLVLNVLGANLGGNLRARLLGVHIAHALGAEGAAAAAAAVGAILTFLALVVAGTVVAVIADVRRYAATPVAAPFRFRFSRAARLGTRWILAPMRLRPLPLLIVFGCVAAFVVSSHTVDVRTLAAFLLVLGTYGVVGLFVEPSVFRRGLPIAVLFSVVLPVGQHVEMFVGFAARSMTAEVVEKVLSLWKLPAISAQSILFLESGTAYVDEPCSGLRSLWSGALFFLGLTYVQRARVDLRWAMLGTAHLVLLGVANVLRVLVIVLIAILAGQPKLAHLLHASVGNVGFIAVSLTTYLLGGRFLLVRPERSPSRWLAAGSTDRPLVYGLSLLFIGAWAMRGEPSPRISRDTRVIDVRFPKDELLDMSPTERRFFARVGATSAIKRRFEFGAFRGTSIVVNSERLSAHHPPEACLSAAGFKVDALNVVSVANVADAAIGGLAGLASNEASDGNDSEDGRDGNIRVASVDRGAKTAIYWFQSPSMTTGSLLARLWAQWWHDDARWVMISILVQGPLYDDDAGVRALFAFVHGRVKEAWFEPDGVDGFDVVNAVGPLGSADPVDPVEAVSDE
ncbi:MAG: exosortase O [Deltaproteobacteria bacterium]|nr:exosortase O [Deltaproteobacteria bacterium]